MTDLRQDNEQRTALQKSRVVAMALSSTARKLRFSTSNRSSLYEAVGLRPRFADRLFRWCSLSFFVFILVLPNIASMLYFGVFASDQYQSESRFVVRTSTPAIGKDQLGKITGLPSAKIAQDTQIVTNFIHSRTILEFLEKEIDVRRRFEVESADVLARLKVGATYEEFLDYWDGMVKTYVSPSSGIVTVTVRAFSPRDAKDILDAILRESERTINQLSDRIWKDVVSTTKSNLDRASARLREVRARVATEQNKTGILSVEGSSLMLSNLITSLQKEKLELERSYAVKLDGVSKDAPQMRVLAREIQSKEAQIDELRKQVAGTGQSAEDNLASVSVELSGLQFELQLAEQQFAASVRSFEQVQFISKQQLMYLDSFLEPNLPDEALFPRRAFWMLIAAISSVIAWAASVGALVFARSKLAG
ncbi:capsule biosynthesis protein [Ensifer adhaerens]|uniref:capsule biosynthesis protein n=1 Tax=Ensifer adhaerens TaxID=106592 RepID=UPI001CBF783D|nr:capsule biosynthesis protein [Ensifer adhaerens]UAX95102.1 capsule biosynthesis protein [Ensifer adhaerens]UAY03006.1 capsule biosynthesis protein [Ensifer adhaerens]UAY10991.1 capsule biosynthesis protein [Ensifer adhaerens]